MARDARCRMSTQTRHTTSRFGRPLRHVPIAAARSKSERCASRARGTSHADRDRTRRAEMQSWVVAGAFLLAVSTLLLALRRHAGPTPRNVGRGVLLYEIASPLAFSA